MHDPPRRRQRPYLTVVDARLRHEVGKWAILNAISMRRSSFRDTSRSMRNANASRSVICFPAASSSRLSSWSRMAVSCSCVSQADERLVVHRSHLRSSRRRPPHGTSVELHGRLTTLVYEGSAGR